MVRVGATVRRPAHARSGFVAELLAHLERRGFAGAPRHLGVDGAGRDVFSYLPGRVPARLRPFSGPQVAAAGALLRAFHDATRGSGLAAPYPVVCHLDPGPNNAVFQRHRPVALIDFDTAAPGDPLDDLGAMAWLWCWSARTDRRPVAAQARQVGLLADAYGLDPAGRRALPAAIAASQHRNTAFWQARAATGHPRAAAMLAWTDRELRHTTRHRHALAIALGR